MSGNRSRQSRTRSVKRTFVLLRFELRVPTAAQLTALENAGRVKQIEFANNATSGNISDVLLHHFQGHLRRNDLARYGGRLALSFQFFSLKRGR